jgi:tetratricopeptide (TPR) repeat protein
MLGRLELVFRPEPMTGEPCPDDPLAGEILRRYTRTLSSTSVLLPTAALRCLHRLQQLAGGRQLLLAADKGDCRESDLDNRDLPDLSLHGSVSMVVNFHAIAELFRQRGGEALAVPGHWTPLHIFAGLLGTPAAGLGETRLAFHQEIETRSPDDYFALKDSIEDRCEELPLEHVAAFLRFSGGDSEAFLSCLPALWQRAKAAPHLWEGLRRIVQEVWENHLPLPGEPNDLAFHLGTLLVELAAPEAALEMFGHSLDSSPPAVVARAYNTALCYWQMEDWKSAHQWLDRVLALDPACELAVALRIQVAARLAALPAERTARDCGAG